MDAATVRTDSLFELSLQHLLDLICLSGIRGAG